MDVYISLPTLSVGKNCGAVPARARVDQHEVDPRMAQRMADGPGRGVPDPLGVSLARERVDPSGEIALRLGDPRGRGV